MPSTLHHITALHGVPCIYFPEWCACRVTGCHYAPAVEAKVADWELSDDEVYHDSMH